MSNENVKKVLKEIEFLVNVAYNSVFIKKIVIQEEDRNYVLRPQFHVLLRANTGSLKSTILTEIENTKIGISVDDATKPGLVGTIDSKTFQFIPGVAWEGRNHVLLFDEFKFRRKSDDWVVFLKILEEQRYARKFGMFSSKSEYIDGDLFCYVDKGSIRFRTRFAAIVATMRKFESIYSQDFQAFLTRVVPYDFELSLDEIDYILSGIEWFQVKKFGVLPEYEIKKRKYNEIRKYVRNCIVSSGYSDWVCKDNFARLVGDVVRMMCVQGKFDKNAAKRVVLYKLDAYNKIGKWKRDKKSSN